VETHGVGTVGILANPMAGRDVRRLIGRALQQTPDMKRNQIQRAVVGAVAAGARRVLLMRDVFRAAESAIESLRLHADVALLDGPIETNAGDTRRNALALRDAGCGALIVLGGDGTNRQVALAWPDAPLIPLSTGTNNVFPEMLEATSAGAAAGLVAAGAVSIDEVSRRCKVVEVEYPNSETDLALVDVALLEGDHLRCWREITPAACWPSTRRSCATWCSPARSQPRWACHRSEACCNRWAATIRGGSPCAARRQTPAAGRSWCRSRRGSIAPPT